jgi:hypothetical protein
MAVQVYDRMGDGNGSVDVLERLVGRLERMVVIF